MASTLDTVTVDCGDPRRLAHFWAGSLGWVVDDVDDDGAFIRPGDDHGSKSEAVAARPTGLFFQKVPEPKTVKNRVHLDLQPTDRSRDEEVERLLALGATPVADHRRPDGTGWAVLADPEGNELCVERSAAERAATPSA